MGDQGPLNPPRRVEGDPCRLCGLTGHQRMPPPDECREVGDHASGEGQGLDDVE